MLHRQTVHQMQHRWQVFKGQCFGHSHSAIEIQGKQVNKVVESYTTATELHQFSKLLKVNP